MMKNNEPTGVVFNIQKFSVHDGPGIRTVIFLKGCPLKCYWCANPESQRMKPELLWHRAKCTNCLKCLKSQDQKIRAPFQDGGASLLKFANPDCSDFCPTRALERVGKTMTISQILNEVESDEVFYSRSSGGITLSGGEPLLQSTFTIELLKRAKEAGLHCAIETCGYVEWTVLENACCYLDYLFFDIKSMDDVKHIEHTGVSNKKIVTNFVKVSERFKHIPICVRTPIIPEFNDNEKDILDIINLIKGRHNVTYEILPYHRLGEEKYHSLGQIYPMQQKELKPETMSKLKIILSKEGY